MLRPKVRASVSFAMSDGDEEKHESKDENEDNSNDDDDDNEDNPEQETSFMSLFVNVKREPPEDVDKLLKDTLEMLAVSAIHIPESTAVIIYHNVQRLAQKKFTYQSQLGGKPMLETLLSLFANYNTNEDVIVDGCKTLSQMMISDTENKRMLGSIGACRDVVNMMTLHSTNRRIIMHCLQLVIHLCNSTFRHDRSAEAAASNEANPLDITTCNNRLNLHRAGICTILHDHLKPVLTVHSTVTVSMTGNHHHQHEELIVMVCNTIAILAENDKVSKAMGEAGLCVLVTDILKLTSFMDLVIAASWALIIMCSDNRSGNKQLFCAAGIVDILLKNLQEYRIKIPHYARIPEFFLLMERQCWCLVNLSVSCPHVVQDLKTNAHCKETLEFIIGSHMMKESARSKAKVVFKRVFQQ